MDQNIGGVTHVSGWLIRLHEHMDVDTFEVEMKQPHKIHNLEPVAFSFKDGYMIYSNAEKKVSYKLTFEELTVQKARTRAGTEFNIDVHDDKNCLQSNDTGLPMKIRGIR